MLRARLLTAIVLIPVVAWLMYLGGLPFFALISILATIAEIELTNLVAQGEFRPIHLFGVGTAWICLLDARYPEWALLTYGLGAILVVSLGWQVLHYRSARVREWTGSVASGLYVGLCSSFLIRLRALPGDGLWWIFIAVPVTLLADSTAYVVGTLWGRQKLAPLLSSGKTVEGHASGVLAGGAMGALLGGAAGIAAGPGTGITWVKGLALGVLIATLAPIGDLAVSMVKREAGVEDSGKLLPGHGGVLDRLDTVLFAAVLSYTYVGWFLPCCW